MAAITVVDISFFRLLWDFQTLLSPSAAFLTTTTPLGMMANLDEVTLGRVTGAPSWMMSVPVARFRRAPQPHLRRLWQRPTRHVAKTPARKEAPPTAAMAPIPPRPPRSPCSPPRPYSGVPWCDPNPDPDSDPDSDPDPDQDPDSDPDPDPDPDQDPDSDPDPDQDPDQDPDPDPDPCGGGFGGGFASVPSAHTGLPSAQGGKLYSLSAAPPGHAGVEPSSHGSNRADGVVGASVPEAGGCAAAAPARASAKSESAFMCVSLLY
jgi:hypothetical protein